MHISYTCNTNLTSKTLSMVSLIHFFGINEPEQSTRKSVRQTLFSIANGWIQTRLIGTKTGSIREDLSG